MAQRVELRSATCPPNTPQASAQQTDLSFRQGVVVGIEIVIPDGHGGVTGLALGQAHQVLIPASGSVWIVGNDEVIRWPLDGFLDSGSWQAFTFNTDAANPHSWFFRFLVNETQLTPVGPGAQLPAGAIEQAGAAPLTSSGGVILPGAPGG